MNMLTVCAVVCTIMAVSGAAVVPEIIANSNETAKSHLVKIPDMCGVGWSEFNQRCFYYIAKPLTWAKAEQMCQSLGGHLASVHNLMEYHELQRLIIEVNQEYKETWIGGSDAQEENHWFWSDGTTFDYTNWCPGEPNNTGRDQHCMTMNYGDGKCWDDFGCFDQRPSICAMNK